MTQPTERLICVHCDRIIMGAYSGTPGNSFCTAKACTEAYVEAAHVLVNSPASRVLVGGTMLFVNGFDNEHWYERKRLTA